MSKCTLCPLHIDSKVNLINGYGPQPASILFIGEAPGEEEEKTGRPFTGPAGQLFDQLMKDAGLNREECRITNVCRCRPIDKANFRVDRRNVTHYGNRAPTENEVYVCAPTYLDAEIAATKPTVIVPVGNTALHYIQGEYKLAGTGGTPELGIPQYKQQPDGTFMPLLEKAGGKVQNITAARGVEWWSEKYQCKVIPIIHPSALLRGARQINTTVEDLRRIKEASKTKELRKAIEVKYHVIDTWEDVLTLFMRLEEYPEWSVDVETTGFDWMRDRLVCIGFSWKEGMGVSLRILDETGKDIFSAEQERQIKQKLNVLFQDEAKLKICFNGKFDFHHLQSWGIQYPKNVFDVMLAHHLLDSDTEHGLKTLSWIYTDMGGYDQGLEKHFEGMTKMEKNFLVVPRDVMGKYNAADCDCTLRLKHRFAKDMKQYPKMEEFFHKWLMPILETVTWIERSGAPVDFDLIKDMHERMSVRCKEIELAFKNYLGLQSTDEFNLNSTKQLREIFFVKLGLKPFKMGKSGPSLDEESINEIAKANPSNPLVQLVTEYRSLKKSMSTYLHGIKNAALFGRAAVSDEIKDQVWTKQEADLCGLVTDGRVHCDFLLHGTVTGRLSSRNPNLQNIPRVTEEDVKRGFVIRTVFKADPGHKLLAADLSQAELWILYALSKDQALLDALNSPEGVHKRFATRLFNVPVPDITNEQKSIAKTVVFGIVYGRQHQSIAEQFKISEAEAKSYVDGFHTTFPAASFWMKDIVERARKEKRVMSAFGRVRHLPAIDSPHYSSRLEAEHQAVNFPIQSPASDIVQIAGTRVRWEVEKFSLKSRPTWTIHDDNTYHVPDEELEVMSEIVKRNMEAYVPELDFYPKVALEVYQRWKEKED